MGQECDILQQDCPRGYKCIVYNEEGPGSLGDDWGCFPVVEDPVGVGETCTVIDGVGSGLDDCPVGAVCWDVDAETNEGYCVSYCMGSNQNPTCEDPDTFCRIPGDASFGMWCLPVCDPLGDDCGEGLTCTSGDGFSFGCSPDASGEAGAAGDPCEFVTQCDPGLACVGAELVPDCTMSSGCCSAYCTVGDDSPCAPGQTCEPFYDEDPAPHPAWENVGVCALGPG
ncbi:MAG: ribulose phosphate epimerase [Myxococcota bacterium]